MSARRLATLCLLWGYMLISLTDGAYQEVDSMPNFVEFDRLDSHMVPDEPMFTVQRRGLISMNQAAFKALGEPASVALLYDADEGIVGLRKVPRTYNNGYPVRKQANSRSYLVGAQGFMSYNKVDTDSAKRFVGRQYGDSTWGFALAEGTVLKSRTKTPGATVHELREPDRSIRRPSNGHSR